MSSGRRRRRYWVELSFNIVGECCISLLRLGALPRFHVTEHAASAALSTPPLISRRRRTWKAVYPVGGELDCWVARQEKKKHSERGRLVEKGEESCRGTSERDGRNLLYRPTCRRCNFNGGSGVSWRIVRSRGRCHQRGYRE